MAPPELKGSEELVAEHQTILREYARRVLVEGETLGSVEDADRAVRMREFLTIGSSFDLRESEMVALLLRGLMTERGKCGCPTCRNRAARKQ